MIVAATLPLVAEHGAAVTTSRIARAAGIGEGTIFRVFKDKDELLDACVAEAVGVDHVLREIASVPLDEPLAVRLTEAAEAVCAHMERMGTVVTSLHATGHRRGREQPPDRPRTDGEPPQDGRTRSFLALRDAVVELLEPDRAALRLSPERVAAAFLGLLFSRLPTPAAGAAHDPLSPEELISVLLHGSLTDPADPGSA
ncbi:TetR/AcrR family transcriptional regulator [Streptomyces sp. RS10V-4]|uniref:TetR/AcrR family transcriptional regulator n=1 Tax=Streptomyces rhizoryzae TaxID=2932493 RepID=UPI00200538A1|nr:TetR/AcrR family transcriptional regulator [Streptomyces rhizoryzae]MCK7624580.1 TetR/AcrR family transcriptional regulator [Streptomyces rhizoryzae]